MFCLVPGISLEVCLPLLPWSLVNAHPAGAACEPYALLSNAVACKSVSSILGCGAIPFVIARHTLALAMSSQSCCLETFSNKCACALLHEPKTNADRDMQHRPSNKQHLYCFLCTLTADAEMSDAHVLFPVCIHCTCRIV